MILPSNTQHGKQILLAIDLFAKIFHFMIGLLNGKYELMPTNVRIIEVKRSVK
jgi:hypothetical protein